MFDGSIGITTSSASARLAWIIPIEDLADAYKRFADRGLRSGDLDVNIDVERDRIRELDWSVEKYRRDV